ncbi:MAG: homoserine O-acetyltransferase [Deltaproteobacteria bacterium]|jgi:homoserine O-acetyltransferase|nr:homoserine O-acetyltransferase [Deltaproteobacteria bacterium]
MEAACNHNSDSSGRDYSYGPVEKQFFSIEDKDFTLQCGEKLQSITIAYETFGTLDENKSNAVLVFHALTGDSHAAGFYKDTNEKPGWWDIVIGPGKAIDTDKYFVICSNFIGGCMGSTGPSSTIPGKKELYGMNFPVITVTDMVRCQKKLMDHLNIKQLLSVTGGSLGGMQAMEWSVRYPDMVKSVIPLATTMKHSALAIAFNEVARHAIKSDPNWNKGNYSDEKKPNVGLSVARMIGHITYLSDESMRLKFGRKLQDKKDLSFTFDSQFQVENYLKYQGEKFVDRFDANSFLYITKAADYYDLEMQHGNGSSVKAFSKAKAKFLVISFSSDWLYPTYESKAIVKALKKNRLDVSFCEIESNLGHDAFLLFNNRLNRMIKGFLATVYKGVKESKNEI